MLHILLPSLIFFLPNIYTISFSILSTSFLFSSSFSVSVNLKPSYPIKMTENFLKIDQIFILFEIDAEIFQSCQNSNKLLKSSFLLFFKWILFRDMKFPIHLSMEKFNWKKTIRITFSYFTWDLFVFSSCVCCTQSLNIMMKVA